MPSSPPSVRDKSVRLLVSRLPCCLRLTEKAGSLTDRPDCTVFWLTLVLAIVPPTFTVCAGPLRLKPLLTLPPITAPEPLLRFLVEPLTSPTTVRPGTPSVLGAGLPI